MTDDAPRLALILGFTVDRYSVVGVKAFLMIHLQPVINNMRHRL
jgi:hypothetical protein